MSDKSVTGDKKSGFFFGWIIVASTAIIAAVGLSMRMSFSIFLPVLVEEFGWSRADTALAASICILFYGVTSPLSGALSDKYGPRKMQHHEQLVDVLHWVWSYCGSWDELSEYRCPQSHYTSLVCQKPRHGLRYHDGWFDWRQSRS